MSLLDVNPATWWVKPALYLIGTLAVTAAIGYGCYRIYDAGGNSREKTVRAEFATRDNEQLIKVIAEKDRLQKLVDAQRRGYDEDLNLLMKQYEGELEHANDQKAKDSVAIANGSLRLRDENARCTALSNIAKYSGTGPAPASGNDQKGAELSPEATGFLFGEVDRADEIVRQLAAAQGVILAQQKACKPIK